MRYCITVDTEPKFHDVAMLYGWTIKDEQGKYHAFGWAKTLIEAFTEANKYYQNKIKPNEK